MSADITPAPPGAPAGLTALRLDALTVRRGRRPVVLDVDLTLAAGETVALIGPNGAGKSTLLQAASGLLPAHRGRVTATGRTATVLQDVRLARRSVRANVELALAWWGVPRRERRRRVEDTLELLGVAHLARRPAGALSGGEARRVHLARGLAVRPDVLLLDEPFAGLDPQAHERLVLDLGPALAASGAAVLVVLHERRDAWALADRVAVLLEGRLAALDAPERLLAAPPSAAVARFLGYESELRLPDGSRLVRDVDVVLDPAGPLGGRVIRTLRREHDVRLHVATDAGTVWVAAPLAPPTPEVRLRVVGGFPVDAADPDLA
ncbi:ATP-binding cassette domain-containing protein [Nocardioides sp. TRM66260-LWL]|uniref:ATP-binding cassette domain-containing protein n=1 Tax=Nocardioides sp. TRM66260-LWL TaxID=2874478 RepID=UPI001CC33A9D|nr:ATP-binding cassette domain-containing protein [Nocardioides sp. TRM66260-LWL]MBZ5735063.1 ATP-binding cassette domain-containing protein [Nocardioides sp. TRM66260-LWL]